MQYLGWGVRAWVFPLIQLIPTLHQFDDHRVAEVDQLEACHVSSTMHEAFQVDVLKALEGQQWKRVVTGGHKSINRHKHVTDKKDNEDRGMTGFYYIISQ